MHTKHEIPADVSAIDIVEESKWQTQIPLPVPQVITIPKSLTISLTMSNNQSIPFEPAPAILTQEGGGTNGLLSDKESVTTKNPGNGKMRHLPSGESINDDVMDDNDDDDDDDETALGETHKGDEEDKMMSYDSNSQALQVDEHGQTIHDNPASPPRAVNNTARGASSQEPNHAVLQAPDKQSLKSRLAAALMALQRTVPENMKSNPRNQRQSQRRAKGRGTK
jgi:hypothetical protein